jgi:DNA-binding MarR family transcriptional regulator
MPTLTERPAPGRAETELAGLLLATLPRLGKLAAQQHEPGGLSFERLRALWQLRQRPLRSGELAQRCALSAPALSELVDSLVREGLCRRTEDSGDRRVVLVELTARGRRELDRAHDQMTERIAQLLAKLPTEKRARLRSALADLQDAIEAMNRETAGAR